eukprot:Gb_13861 [translate_table: standard]
MPSATLCSSKAEEEEEICSSRAWVVACEWDGLCEEDRQEVEICSGMEVVMELVWVEGRLVKPCDVEVAAICRHMSVPPAMEYAIASFGCVFLSAESCCEPNAKWGGRALYTELRRRDDHMDEYASCVWVSLLDSRSSTDLKVKDAVQRQWVAVLVRTVKISSGLRLVRPLTLLFLGWLLPL